MWFCCCAACSCRPEVAPACPPGSSMVVSTEGPCPLHRAAAPAAAAPASLCPAQRPRQRPAGPRRHAGGPGPRQLRQPARGQRPGGVLPPKRLRLQHRCGSTAQTPLHFAHTCGQGLLALTPVAAARPVPPPPVCHAFIGSFRLDWCAWHLHSAPCFAPQLALPLLLGLQHVLIPPSAHRLTGSLGPVPPLPGAYLLRHSKNVSDWAHAYAKYFDQCPSHDQVGAA